MGEKRPEYPESNGWQAPEGDTVEAAAARAYEEFWGLKSHRLLVVRREARTSHIAYAFLRGKQYSEVEAFAHEFPAWEDVKRQVLKFGDDPLLRNTSLAQRYAEWEKDAKAYFLAQHADKDFLMRRFAFKKEYTEETPNESGHI